MHEHINLFAAVYHHITAVNYSRKILGALAPDRQLRNVHFLQSCQKNFCLSSQSRPKSENVLPSNLSLSLPSPNQGDQIGRNFAIWAIFYGVGQIFFVEKVAQ